MTKHAINPAIEDQPVETHHDLTVLNEQQRRDMLRLLHTHLNTVQAMQNGIPELTALADLGNDNPSAQAQQARRQLANYETQIAANQKHADDLKRGLDAAGVEYDRGTLERHSGGVPTVKPRKR